MGFKGKVLPGFFAVVLLYGSIACAQDYGRSRITVFVNDSVGVKPAVLKHAQAEAGRLLGTAGIAIHWVNCADTSDCRRPPRADEFELHIVAKGTTRSDFVFGEAFLGPDGQGQYADVFFNRVREASGRLNIGQLLGAVTAHELGHLLLGSHAHSLVGIMEPVWERASLLKVSMGSLTFTTEQSQSIRARLANQRLTVTSVQDGPSGLQ